jgi:hypothetical protein
MKGVTGRGGLEVCEILTNLHCLHNRVTGGGEIVSLTHRQRSTPQEHIYFCPWYSFVLESDQIPSFLFI